MASPRSLSIDARLAGSRRAGIGRYEAEIIRRLVATPRFVDKEKSLPVQWQIWLMADDAAEWLPSDLPEWVTLHRTSVKHYSLAEQVTWPSQLRREKSDLLWVPHFNVPLLCPVPWVITLHDLLWHEAKDARATTLPAWKHGIKHAGYRLISAQAAKKAEAIMVPSQAVAQDVRARFGADLPLTVTHEGVSEVFLQAPLRRQPSSVPTLLYVGSLYPHKNLTVVLQALRALPGFRLHVVSARSVFTEDFEAEAQRLQVASQVELLGYRTDEEIVQLAQSAFALVQPSTSEGFGLTGLEGMALGVPVVASDLPVFAELYGEHAVSFPRHDAIALSDVLRKLAKHPPSQSTLRAARAHAQKFTWDQTTLKTWQVIAQAWKARYGRD